MLNASADNELFGAWFHRVRRAKGLTQKEIEAKTIAFGNPIYQSRISEIEKKAMKFGIAVSLERADVVALARAVGEDIGTTLHIAGFRADTPGTPAPSNFEADTARMVEQYRGLSTVRQEAIRQMISASAIAEEVERYNVTPQKREPGKS